MKLKYCLLVILWPVLNGYAQSPPVKPRPLMVGDTVPDITLINIYNYPVSKIRLADLRGKLVILDFWGKYCAPCIRTLPKLDSLQQEFANLVQVITVSDFTHPDDLQKAKARFAPLKNLQLPVLLASEQLSALFPHKLLSHIVWISPDGVVKAFTGSEYISKTHIQSALKDGSLDWAMKTDAVEFDYKKPLLSFTQTDIVNPSSLYYSAFTSHISGIAPPSGTETDAQQGISITAFYNYDLLAFCQLAMDYSAGAEKDQFILHVKDSSRFVRGKMPLEGWKKQNTYCYYLRLPASTTMKEIENYVRQDVQRWLAITGIQVRKETCMQDGRSVAMYVVTDTSW